MLSKTRARAGRPQKKEMPMEVAHDHDSLDTEFYARIRSVSADQVRVSPNAYRHGIIVPAGGKERIYLHSRVPCKGYQGGWI